MRTETVQYRHYTESGFEYECTAEISFEKEDGRETYDVTLLTVMYCGLDGGDEPAEAFPYQKNFDPKLRIALENRAIEAYYDQAARKIELPEPQYFTFSVNVQWYGLPNGRLIMVRAYPKSRIIHTFDLAPNRPEPLTEMPNAVYQYLMYCAFGEEKQEDSDHASQQIEEAVLTY